MRRKEIFAEESFYHVFNKSIADFGIFKNENNGWRFIHTLDYYNSKLITKSFSDHLEQHKCYQYQNILIPKKYTYIKIICYSIMPNHYHLLVKILYKGFFSKYIGDVENSYSRFFNNKFKRKGPLWQSSFKAVRIKTDNQLLHVSRYIHLNPSTSGLVENPENWSLSSYKDFISDRKVLTEYIKEISIKTPKLYKRFIEDRKDYQRKLNFIKKLVFD